jgi:hypothetical protein
MEDRTFSEITLGSKDCCLLCNIAERYQQVSERSSTSVFMVHDDTLEAALKLKKSINHKIMYQFEKSG